ncbi:MAG: WG repeat-containing protein [Cytophagales bacterium]|nr:MAG: WG repeat-containing protein [Cytophagales bacterium]TAF61862.1 MAG: WG repeat-containing protein [Cytophagales bacterium]
MRLYSQDVLTFVKSRVFFALVKFYAFFVYVFRTNPTMAHNQMKKHQIEIFLSLFFLVFSLVAKAQDSTLVRSDSMSVSQRYITNQKIGLHIIKKGQKFGVVNDTGLVVTPFNYELITFFADVDSSCDHWEGILKIKKGNKYALSYPDGRPFTDMNNDDIQLLEGSCKTLSSPAYLVRVKQNGKWGAADAKGGLFIKTAYDEIKLLLSADTVPTSPEVLRVNKQGKYGMMILKTQEVLPSQYDMIAFHQNIKEKNTQYSLIKLKMNGKFGIYSLKDKSQIPNLYDDIGLFVDGLAPASKNKKYGYIDLKGEEKIKHLFDEASPFRAGYAIVKTSGKFTVINPSGKPQGVKYDDMKWLCSSEHSNSFYKSLVIALKDGKYGVYTTDGKEICAPKFDRISFNERNNSCTGWLNKTEEGIVLRPPSK